ncbi:MAG TPA: DUF1203 domain-containing protein [Pyrinomonadaceae bacterium]|nr:DUF1203 domain-containing protein [Pyrinomonadaceae bacterium]
MNYRIVPIPSEIAESVRQNLKSPQYGHPAFTEIAKGYGPCRLCLKTFNEGAEERILFTYNAFEGLSDLPLPGPVFIHKDKCEPFDEAEFPPDLLRLPLLFEGYGLESKLVRSEKMAGENLKNQIKEILISDEVEYINIRNAEAGCFVARIERA